MSAALRHALARVRTRRGRALAGAAGIVAVAAMVGAAATIAYAFSGGFGRAADRAGLPDAIARFDDRQLEDVAGRAESLANVGAVSYRIEVKGADVEANGRFNSHATVVGVRGRLRGYAVVAGRDVSASGDEVVVERGLAREWHLSPGDLVEIRTRRGGFGGPPLRVVGVAVSPETFAFPIARGPRLFLAYGTALRVTGERPGEVNAALIWVRDRSRLDVTLSQARAAGFGLRSLELQTRAGLEAVISRATGIAVALIGAFSLAALGVAGVILAASSHAEVQRRREAIGVLRAIGARPAEIAGGYAIEAALVAAPAAIAGVLLGWLAVTRPVGRLLAALNELAPGARLAPLLAACVLGVVALVAGATAWPAWRAARRPTVESLRAADVVGVPQRLPLPAGAGGLGARLAAARPLRTAAIVTVLAASASLVLLLLAAGSLLRHLQDSPLALGKRYQLSVPAPATAAPRIAAVAGVAAASPRYETDAADSFDLGQSFEVVAYPGDHTVFEAPELAEGRRLSAPGEAEVGLGLAQALDLHPGATLAVQLATGSEARFRVVGLVRALARQGRMAYVRPDRLLRADPFLAGTVAVRLDPGAALPDVRRRLASAGFFADDVGGLGTEGLERSDRLVGILGRLLLTVVALDALVCLYALVQVLALTALERRRAVAVVRACGGGRREVTALFAGVALPVAAVAAALAVLAERLLLGPAVSRLAASYVQLSLAAAGTESAGVVAGLLAIALVSAGWVARRAGSEPVIAGLRDE